MSTTYNEVLEILEKLVPGQDIAHNQDLVGSGVLDSMTSIMLVSELEDHFAIDVTPLDMVPENFSSAEVLAGFVDRKLS